MKNGIEVSETVGKALAGTLLKVDVAVQSEQPSQVTWFLHPMVLAQLRDLLVSCFQLFLTWSCIAHPAVSLFLYETLVPKKMRC